MALYGDCYEQFSAQTSSAQQQHAQQQSQQYASADGLGSDPYNSELFADPRYHVPPNFLDEPPRGPDAIQLFGARDNQYFFQQPPSQDPPWANYLRLPSGRTPPPPGYPIPRTLDNTFSHPTDPSSYPLYYLDGTDSSLPPHEELAAFPPISLQSHAQDSSNMEITVLDIHNDDKELSSSLTAVQTVAPSQPLPTPQPTQVPPRPQQAVIATPGQPTPFGPLFYSSSGFDMIGVLTRVANRKHPQVVLGPVDFTCSFVVSDAQAPDEPIVYASPTFSELTGYEMSEIVGRNCRFLQAPSGRVRKGETRRFTDDKGVAHIRKSVDNFQECQVSFINYKKSGEAFVNLVTIIPIPWDTDEIRYLIGFQVDLERQPGAILRTMGDGSYAVNYSTSADPFPPMSEKLKSALNLGDSAEDARQKFNDFILEHSDDFIHVVSLKGAFQYVSPSVTAILEYTPEELMGKSISDIAHPSDIVPVMRELKESTMQSHPPSLVSSSTLAQHYLSQAKLVHLLYRVRRRDSGYIWLESTGRLHVESSKGRKSIVFSGRVRRQTMLPWSLVARDCGPGIPTDCWAQVSVDNGIMLSVSTGAHELLGRPAREVQGTTLRDWVAPAWKVAIDAALAEARSKTEDGFGIGGAQGGVGGTLTSITCTRAVPESRSTNTPAITITFFSPDSQYQYQPPSTSTIGSSSTPDGDAMQSTPARSPPPPSLSPPARVPIGGIKRGVRHPTMVCHIRFPPPPGQEPSRPANVQDYLRPPNMFHPPTTPAAPLANHTNHAHHSSSGSSSATTSPARSPLSESGSAAGGGGGVRIVSAALNANVFEELETTRGTSWQYELQQLRMANARLQTEIDDATRIQQKAAGSKRSAH